MSEHTLSQPQLHSSIVAMISLASGIASRHPDMGLFQLERLRGVGIPEHQIEAVIEIARHIRDEASQKLDTAFDAVFIESATTTETATISETENETTDCCSSAAPITEEESCGCTPTPGSQSCC